MYFDGPNSKRNFIVAIVCGYLAISIFIFGIIAFIVNFTTPSLEPTPEEQSSSEQTEQTGSDSSTPSQPDTPSDPEKSEDPGKSEDPEKPDDPDDSDSKIPDEPDKPGTSNIPATGIILKPNYVSINVGNKNTIVATLEPTNSTDKITWSSSNASVATVNGGVVTGVKAGNVTITAKTGSGKTATATVVVAASSSANIPVTSVTVTPASASIAVGNSAKFSASIAPANATERTVTWSSEDSSIATVMGGIVTGKKPEPLKYTLRLIMEKLRQPS